MSKRRVLERQIQSLAKRGYDLYEYEPEIRFRHAPAWLHTAKKLAKTPDPKKPALGVTTNTHRITLVAT
jgi:hypothetical protein